MTLKKAEKKLITQREAAAELGLSIRPVKRLLKELKKLRDRAVVYAMRGKSSKRTIDSMIRQTKILAATRRDST